MLKYFFLFLSFYSYSQNQIDPDLFLPDGPYRIRRLVPYEFVRESDVMFQKRIWRTIDLREKINHPLYYPFDDFSGSGEWLKNANYWSLWTIIRHFVLKGELVIYDNENPNNIGSFDGDLFKYPLQLSPGKTFDTDTIFKENIMRLIATTKQKMNADGTPMVKTDPLTGDVITKMNKDGVPEEVLEDQEVRWVKSEDIIEYRLKEDWFFDKERSQFDMRILALAPVVYDAERNDKGEITTIKGKKILFWLYFPHCRFVFVNYNVINPKNDAQWMSFDDLFQKRQFNSTIYKQSNTFDRTIDTYRSGIDALYESQQITEEFRNLEHDLWHF